MLGDIPGTGCQQALHPKRCLCLISVQESIFQAWLVACRVRMGVGSEPLLGSIGSPVAPFATTSEACPRTTSASFVRGDVSEDACCCALTCQIPRAAVGPQSTRKPAGQAMWTTAQCPKLARSRPAKMRRSLREQLLSVLSTVPNCRFSRAFAVPTGVARWKLSDLVPDGTGLATGW